MSRVIQLLVFAICAAFCSASFAQGCKYSGAPAWNESVRELIADCAAEFPSPNKRLVLKFASNGRISIKGKTIVLKGRRVEPPAMFSWSPQSDAFFINDGEGSGMSSIFRLFRINFGLGELKVTFEDLIAAFLGSLIVIFAWRIICKGQGEGY